MKTSAKKSYTILGNASNKKDIIIQVSPETLTTREQLSSMIKTPLPAKEKQRLKATSQGSLSNEKDVDTYLNSL